MPVRLLVLLLVLLVVTRCLLLASAAEVHGYGEEFAKGAAARLLVSDLRALHGTGIPAWNVPYVLHEGGGTIVTFLKAGAFLLVGPTVLANKLVALATTLGVLVALALAARELFGPRAALVAGLAFVFAPEAFLRFSLLSLGTHFEASFFALALLALAARIARGREAGAAAWFALGVAAALGAYASLIVLPAIVTAFARVGLARARELLGRRGAVLAFGALAGAAPWLWMVRHAGLDAVRIRGASPTGGTADPLRAAGLLLQRVFELDLGRLALLAAVVVACGGAVVLVRSLVRVEPALRADATPNAGRERAGVGASCAFTSEGRERAREAAWVGAFVALFLAAYVSSGFALHPDAAWFFFLRTTPAWIGGLLLFAGAVATLWERGGRARALAGATLAVVLAVGVADLGRLVLDGRPAAPLENLRVLATRQGYDWSEYFDKLLPRLDGTVEEKLARLARIDDEPARLDPDLAQSAFEHAGVSLSEALATLHAALGERAPTAITGLRFFVHPNFGHDPEAAFRALAAAPEEDRPALAEAIGRAGLGPRFRADRLLVQLDRAVEAPWRDRWLLGAGWRLDRTFPLRPDRAHAFLDARPTEQRAALERGYRAAAERARVVP